VVCDPADLGKLSLYFIAFCHPRGIAGNEGIYVGITQIGRSDRCLLAWLSPGPSAIEDEMNAFALRKNAPQILELFGRDVNGTGNAPLAKLVVCSGIDENHGRVAIDEVFELLWRQVSHRPAARLPAGCGAGNKGDAAEDEQKHVCRIYFFHLSNVTKNDGSVTDQIPLVMGLH
jgi:hypothetical protein